MEIEDRDLIINDNCDFDFFYLTIEKAKKLKVDIIEIINDFDTMYCDLIYKDLQFTLHYNIYDGLSLYPKNIKSATEVENITAKELVDFLKTQLHEE
jgi:hypothetical protein